MAVLGREAASQAMTSADIVDGAFTLNDLNFTDIPANLDITGTIDKNTMRLAEGVTVIGDVTVNDDLVLAKLSDDGVGITMTTDGTTRTITGSGSIESTTIAQTHSPSLTGMTGTISSGTTFPAGHILQVIQTVKSDTTSYNTTDAWADITGMSVAITPSLTSSKILVMFTANIGAQGNSSNSQAVALQLMRDSTAIFVGDAAGSRLQSFSTAQQWESEAYSGMYIFSGQYLDSPSSTSSISYNLEWRKPWDLGNPIYLNRSYTDTDNNDRGRGASSITVMEVSG